MNKNIKITLTDEREDEVKNETLEEENKRLRKELAILKQEKEILKKAAAYFAKETL